MNYWQIFKDKINFKNPLTDLTLNSKCSFPEQDECHTRKIELHTNLKHEQASELDRKINKIKISKIKVWWINWKLSRTKLICIQK